jgi:hypothetical protein
MKNHGEFLKMTDAADSWRQQKRSLDALSARHSSIIPFHYTSHCSLVFVLHKSSSLIMSSTIQEHSDPHTQVVVFVDPYSTECVTAQEMVRRGYNVMALWTHGFADEMKLHVPLSCAGLEYVAEITQIPDQVDATIELLRQTAGDLEIVACLAGGEAGVDFADVLSERMGLLSNGTDVPNRRDKKIQQELIAAAGMRSVRQAGGDKFEHVESFLKTESYPLVVKPTESAGSDGVKLCHSFEEAKEHFHLLMKKQASGVYHLYIYVLLFLILTINHFYSWSMVENVLLSCVKNSFVAMNTLSITYRAMVSTRRVVSGSTNERRSMGPPLSTLDLFPSRPIPKLPKF